MKVEELNNLFASPEDVLEVEELEKEVEEEDVVKEDDIEQDEEEIVDASPVYNILKDYNIVPEMENPTEEQIREHLENLGSSKVSEFFSTKPTRFQELASYALVKEDITDDDLDDFYNKYLKKEKYTLI